jgi:hypothetical protein
MNAKAKVNYCIGPGKHFVWKKSSKFFTVGSYTLFYSLFLIWAHLVWLWVTWSGERAGRYTLSLTIPDQGFQSFFFSIK